MAKHNLYEFTKLVESKFSPDKFSVDHTATIAQRDSFSILPALSKEEKIDLAFNFEVDDTMHYRIGQAIKHYFENWPIVDSNLDYLTDNFEIEAPDVIAIIDDDDSYLDGAYSTDNSSIEYYNGEYKVLRQWYKTDSRTNRPYLVAQEIDSDSSMYSLIFKTDKNGNIKTRTYGIGRTFDAIDDALASIAAKEAMNTRTNSDDKVHVVYEMRIVGSGTARRK